MNEKIDELRNEAFGLFLELKDKELWESLEDGLFFAVNLPGKEPSFVEVGTLEKDKPVINVYWNSHDLGKTDLLNRIHYHRTPFSIYSALTEQNLAQVAFDERDRLVEGDLEHFIQYAQSREADLSKWKRFPNLISFETGLYPKELNDEEKLETLVRCLKAAVDVAEKLKSETAEELGFVPNSFYFPASIPLLTETADGFDWSATTFPQKESEELITYEYNNDALTKEVKALEKIPQREAYLVRFPVPVTMESPSGESLPPFYPMGLAVTTMRHLDYPENIFFGLAKDYTEESLGQLLDRLAERLIEIGEKPERLNCYDDRTVALLKDFGKKTGIGVVDRRKANNEQYTNLPVRLYNDVIVSLKKFDPMPEEILTNMDPKAEKIYKQLTSISAEDSILLRTGGKINIEGLGKIDQKRYLRALPAYAVKSSTPKNRKMKIDQGIFPENYDRKKELRSFSRLKPPKVGALSYVFSVTAEPGNYTHIQVDGESFLDDLVDYVIDTFDASFFFGRIAMDNKFYTDAHTYEVKTSRSKHAKTASRSHRCCTNEITLKELDLQKGQKFKYIFERDRGRYVIQFKVLRAVPEASETVKTLRDKSSKMKFDDDDW